jgi:hypothetical protein
LGNIIILKDFVLKGAHQNMSTTYMTFQILLNDLGELLHISAIVNEPLRKMMSLMNSITAQHFELSNSAKGLHGSNFIYDQRS